MLLCIPAGQVGSQFRLVAVPGQRRGELPEGPGVFGGPGGAGWPQVGRQRDGGVAVLVGGGEDTGGEREALDPGRQSPVAELAGGQALERGPS